MTKEDPDDIQDVPIPIIIDKRTSQTLEKLLIDTNTGNMDKFHPVTYVANINDPDNPRLHEAMNGLYREGFIDIMDDKIDILHKKKKWYIIA